MSPERGRNLTSSMAPSSAATVPLPQPPASTPRRKRTSMAPVARPPKVSWESLRSKLAAEWASGECVTIIGPRGSGKTHICLHLADLSPYVLFLATKRTDPLISALQEEGYLVTGRLEDVLWEARGDDKRPKP